MSCPNCQYVRKREDQGVPEGTCPSCGIAYVKWLEKLERANSKPEPPPPLPPFHEQPPVKHRMMDWFLFVPSDRHESAFWGHALLYAFFFVYGWRFILHGIDYEFIGRALLHYPNLAIHEFGHLIFRPFGELVMFLGGSLTQVLMPLALVGFFTFWQRENFASSLCLWWMGQNFIDVSVYIQDAPYRALPLVGGGGPESHDWWNILTMTGQLDAAGFYAGLWFTIGACLIVLANVWGGWLFYIELLGREVIRDEELVEED